MSDRNDLTPPPDERVPDDRKRAIRAQLLASADSRPTTPGRRWLAPGLAAAAVLTIVGLGAFAANRYDSSIAPGSTETLAPAGRATTPLSAGPSDDPSAPGRPSPTDPSDDPSAPGDPPPTEAPSSVPETTAAPSVQATPPAESTADACEDEVKLLHEPTLRGASVTAERGYGSGTTYLYETKSAWVVCDDLSASDGGSPTLFSPHDKSQSYQPDTSTLAISENVITKPDGTWASAQYVAAGRDFDGVQAISYAFPDGHTEDAVVGRNGLWSMTYLATDGPLFNPRTNALDLEPIEVTVDYTSGDDRTFTLEWALDTCAQINHGC